MKKVLCFSLLILTTCEIFGQDVQHYIAKNRSWGISIDTSNLLNFVSGQTSQNTIAVKYLCSDDFALTLGISSMSAIGKNTFVEDTKDMSKIFSIGYSDISLGGQYFYFAENRLRCFSGMSVSFVNSWGIAESNDEKLGEITIAEIITSPIFLTIGTGAEFFLYPSVSLSTDLSLIATFRVNREEVENGIKSIRGHEFMYATYLGGLGGKLALNIYF